MRKVVTQAHVPNSFDIEIIGENKARISAWPFEIGFAITLAHPLKRLLALGAVGYAATAIKIDGINHEFDSKRGMLEDISLFIINIKNTRFRFKNPESKKEVLEFNFKGAKEIRGADLVNENVEVVNPDIYIATINEDTELSFTLIVEKGIGYVASEDLRERNSNDFISIDAFFNPVRNVSYKIENVLHEDNPDHEKIVFDITTDGQISPEDAFKNALEAMYQQMSVFEKITDKVKKPQNKQSKESDIDFTKLLKSVKELGFTVRSSNALEIAGIKYVGELALMSIEDINNLKNVGKKSVDEIVATMKEIGYPIGSNSTSAYKEQLKEKIAELKNKG
ncbi:DNA-directed RNA polymerase subunit alpha [Campylobacter canadensis]|uniref:DNA-directed RNA polymerase subunit alpha n=1 Tax=Campylobacter canadensis TaxID=449520 RepID=A0ABS7WR69_9BACT|nr:DNA-directed RNA polymerase subunit alpha [Campylobacter canadensis]MBZ7986569.1 DNA-directed RNA polymerase subunit alpha [Campylobacter canadensis]MBZ7994026.1 DNA-directed RNA polymerase subunit alpha [Campylobacter canadensis]MBZ7995971.1 DNA-directed RNA polymerase subunit alpha [Campylobacter canadensis]MBZ7997605.1 DNA-directed RNA polymerase subunit alpha [Campylobacter canadensis]MBZ7999357.1 DNA-directed RNA polymerase subunit alpha [Campylobacter canadensis]